MSISNELKILMIIFTVRDLSHIDVLVLHDPWVCTITTGMQNGDEGLQSIILAKCGILVNILITLEPHVSILIKLCIHKHFSIIKTQ